jgi:glutamate-1-semialdehyde 2,1-aminomutase
MPLRIGAGRSEALHKRAREVLPGGVNSPVRAWRAVGGVPRFISSARGARLTDADGNEYIDYVMSYGAIILGHADERVGDAINAAVARGSSYGAPTEDEVLLAERIREAVPSIEMLRLVSSGTEAAMSALRLARGATGRPLIVKFDGCYHGHSDALLARAGSGIATLGIPGTKGVTQGATADTIVLAYNDRAAVSTAFEEFGDRIACVIVEPVAANIGVLPPSPGFLEALRASCDRAGALLIFDEVITGFRLGPGGAQQRFEVIPDLTCLGKVIGGGLPIGAFGGRRDVMDQLAPDGPVYQAGTLSGNPVTVAAGLATLAALATDPPYERLGELAAELCEGLAAAARDAGVPVTINRESSLFGVFFTAGPVATSKAARRQDADAYARFFHAMIDRGFHLAPGAFEAWFLSAAHTRADIEATVEAAAAAFAAAKR